MDGSRKVAVGSSKTFVSSHSSWTNLPVQGQFSNGFEVSNRSKLARKKQMFELFQVGKWKDR